MFDGAFVESRLWKPAQRIRTLRCFFVTPPVPPTAVALTRARGRNREAPLIRSLNTRR
jgi:hypothetical protein